MTAAYTAIPLITPIQASSFTAPPTANTLDFVETASGGPVAGDQLGDEIALYGPLLLTAHNTDAAGQTLSVLSVADAYGRKGDITAYAAGTGLRSALFLRPEAWAQGGELLTVASAITQKYAAFVLPGIAGLPWSATSGVVGTRVAINPICAVGPYAGLNGTAWPTTTGQPAALALDYTMTAMSATVGNNIAMNGPLLLVFTNSNAVAKTFTISSTAVGDPLNRTGDITYSIAQNILSAILVRPEGFRQTDGNLYLIANSVNVSVAAFALPG
jgi:hypothetical protein